MSKVGFIGLGIMGQPMAGHLQTAGHELFIVKHWSPLPGQLLTAGAVTCGSPKEVAERAEIIITILPDTPDVEAVLFGENGVADGLSASNLRIALARSGSCGALGKDAPRCD